VRAAGIAVLLAGAAAFGHAAAADVVEERRAAIARELIRVADELQRRIVAGDAEALLARVPPEGLRCAGRVVPRAKVARDLRGPGSWLHQVYLGRAAAGRRDSPPASLAAFLSDAKEVAVLVSFRPDPRAGPTGRPCVDFRAKDVPTPGAPLCFERRDGRWWLTESLYPCG
jgi:hypothetical protein